MTMTFREFYGDTWRDKVVTHRTPTGKTSRAKVGSLSAEEQAKYNPNRFKRTGADTKMTKSDHDALDVSEELKHLLDFYIAVRDESDLESFEEGKPTLATNESGNVIELFDDDLLPATVKGVPIDAVTKYRSKDDDEDEDWLDFPEGMSDQEKYDFIKFEDYDIFQLNLFPYQEEIEVNLDIKEDNDDEI